MLVSGEYPSEKAGGIATVVYNLSLELERRSIEHKIVCTKQFECASDKGIFLQTWGMGPIRDLSFGQSFRRYIKNEEKNWDIFHFHLPNGLGPLFLNPRNIVNRSIVTIHTTSEGFNQYVYQRTPFEFLDLREKMLRSGFVYLSTLMEKQAFGNARILTTASTGVKNEVERWYHQRNVSVINNGIDMTKLGIPNRTKSRIPQILFVGRLSSQKGLHYGIKALSRVKQDYAFKIIGTGSYRDQLEKLCLKNNVSSEFLGYVDTLRLYKHYASSDLLLMPSLYEGFPIVGIEGAGSGLPISGHRAARIDDIVCRENRELLTRTGDTDSLSKAIEYLLSDNELRQEIGEKNRSKVHANLTSERMVDQYIRLFSKF
jgi:glycosyltransferase involved in cell wall biosynthesis